MIRLVVEIGSKFYRIKIDDGKSINYSKSVELRSRYKPTPILNISLGELSYSIRCRKRYIARHVYIVEMDSPQPIRPSLIFCLNRSSLTTNILFLSKTFLLFIHLSISICKILLFPTNTKYTGKAKFIYLLILIFITRAKE